MDKDSLQFKLGFNLLYMAYFTICIIYSIFNGFLFYAIFFTVAYTMFTYLQYRYAYLDLGVETVNIKSVERLKFKDYFMFITDIRFLVLNLCFYNIYYVETDKFDSIVISRKLVSAGDSLQCVSVDPNIYRYVVVSQDSNIIGV